MEKYHIVKDGAIIAETATKTDAIEMIRLYQEKETHYILRPEFSIICGNQEFINYKK